MLNSCLSTKTNKSLVGGSYGGSWRDAKTNQEKSRPLSPPPISCLLPHFFSKTWFYHICLSLGMVEAGVQLAVCWFSAVLSQHMHQVTTLCFTKCSQVVEQIWNMYHSQKIFVLLELVYRRRCWNLVPCSSFRQRLENEPKKSICHTHWLVRNCVNELY